ncbi:MAG: DUF1269 domain-containing protein [Umezawaea sp.]
MAVVTAWCFATHDGADGALDAVLDSQVGLYDAAVLSWPPGLDSTSARLPGRGAGGTVLGGAFWGLVIGLPLPSVVACSVAGAVVGLLLGRLTRPVLSDDVVRDARRRIRPGTSLLLLLSDEPPAVPAAKEAAGAGSP